VGHDLRAKHSTEHKNTGNSKSMNKNENKESRQVKNKKKKAATKIANKFRKHIEPQVEYQKVFGEDKNIKIWDFDTDKPIELEGDRHTQWVLSVAFSSDNKTLASGSEDETIKLWNVKTGRLIKTLKDKSPYQEMNITGVKGLTEAQKITFNHRKRS
jgi:WD40 repeat protein